MAVASTQLPRSLTRIVPWAQTLLAPVLRSGALAVDLTAGTGRDTLFLFHQVGPAGRVIAFDIQSEALRQTTQLLVAAGATVHRHPESAVRPPLSAGVHLFPVGHEHLATVLSEPAAAIVANLGYLPGGNPALVTRVDSTVAALGQACRLLMPAGRLAVVVYPGHPGGDVEAAAVAAFFAALDPGGWQTLRLSVPNGAGGPLLLLGEKR